jgi:hypothetical protein
LRVVRQHAGLKTPGVGLVPTNSAPILRST